MYIGAIEKNEVCLICKTLDHCAKQQISLDIILFKDYKQTFDNFNLNDKYTFVKSNLCNEHFQVVHSNSHSHNLKYIGGT